MQVEIMDVRVGKVELKRCSGINPEFTVHPTVPTPLCPHPPTRPTEDLLISKYLES